MALPSDYRLVVAFILLFLSESALSFLPPWPLAVGLALAAGFAFGLVEAGIGTFVLMAAKDNQAVAMSKLEVFFGIGALLMPFLSSYLIVQGVWSYSFLVLGMSALLMTVAWRKLSFGYLDELLAHRASQDQVRERTGFERSMIGILLLFMVVFFLYVGAEITIVNFLPSIFIEAWNASSSVSTLSVTAFWLAMVIGRLFAGVIAEKLSYFRFLCIACLGSLVSLVALAYSHSLWAGFSFVLALGLFMAGIFAVALIYANQRLPGMTEQATSLLIASGGLGGALLPLAVGWGMDRFQAQMAIWFFAAIMAAELLLLVTSRRLGRKTTQTSRTSAL